MLHCRANVYVVQVCQYVFLIFEYICLYLYFEYFIYMGGPGHVSTPNACSDHHGGQRKVLDALD